MVNKFVILSIECFLLFIVTNFHWFQQCGLISLVLFILGKLVLVVRLRLFTVSRILEN